MLRKFVLRALPAILTMLLLAPLAFSQNNQGIVPQGRETRAVDLLGDVGFETALSGGVTFDSIQLQADQVVYALRRVGAKDADRPLARIYMRPLQRREAADPVGKQIALHPEILEQSPLTLRYVNAGVASILARERPDFFDVPKVETRFSTGVILRGVGAVLIMWAILLIIWLTVTKSWRVVQFRFKPTHLLPAVLQCTIYAYWGSQNPAVVAQFLPMASQIAFAYLLDFLCGITLRRRWDATFGPIPIVLSANLFVWFPPDAAHLAYAVAAVAVASKWFIQRGGRHIFNPSALAVALVGVVMLGFPQAPDRQYQDISHLIAQPQYMMPLLLVLALVAQIRVPIVLISLSSSLVLLALKGVGAYHVVYPFWPGVFLALTLLATDPATIPQTSGGRLVYGLMLGLLLWAISAWLTYANQSDFYGKVLAIPLLNLAAPWFDALAARLEKQLRWTDVRYNWGHIAVWLAVAGGFIFLQH